MALTQEELLNLQRFAPITRPTSPYSNLNNPTQQVRTFLSNTQAATPLNPYASLMALNTQQEIKSSTGGTGGFDPSIYKKLPGLLTTSTSGTGTGTVGGSGGGNDNIVVGGGGGGGAGNLGVGPGQGVSSDVQNAALALIALGDKYPAFLPGGIFAKVLGLLGGVTADSQTTKMSDANKAIEAIDKQKADALESGSSRTFDPYSGTKGVMSVSDKEGNVRSFDPYAGDSAKDAGRTDAIAVSIADAREARDIQNAAALGTAPAAAAVAGPSTAAPAALGLLGSDTALDNLGDRPQSNPTASLPSPGYFGTTLGLLNDLLAGSAFSLNTAPVETREVTPNTYASDFVGPMPQSNTYASDFVGPMPQSNQFDGGLLGNGLVGDFAARQDEANAAVIASDNAAKENAAIAAALSSAAADIAAADKAAADKAAADKAAADKAADANAATGGGGYGSGGADAGPGGTGGGAGGFGPQYRGGLITPRDVKGPNPRGPDDGQASLDIGEYVIRKSAVQKYGPNIFEQINAGRIPAKRLKTLLE